MGLRLQLFLDQSSIEVFVNHALVSLTAQLFPDAPLTGIRLFSEGGEVKLLMGKVHHLGSIWGEIHTTEESKEWLRSS